MKTHETKKVAVTEMITDDLAGFVKVLSNIFIKQVEIAIPF